MSVLAKTFSVALVGTEARLIEVEVDVSTGVPRFSIVGLPTRSVREAEQRTRSALGATEQRWPAKRIVANLAPGALRKEGTHFDLPIALGVLAGDGRIEGAPLHDWVAVGELALDGSLRPVRGALAAALACRASGRGLICPAQNAPEAGLVGGVEVVAVANLDECLRWLRKEWRPPEPQALPAEDQGACEDLAEVRGHPVAKRALEVAAAGGHNMLLSGPPGSGKTMLAQRLPGVLPPMTNEESLEVTRIFSVAGQLGTGGGLVRRRPFRSPHHHISLAGLVGGGTGLARPGEVSLAHFGVLFLDELTLYRRDVLETLRAPLEEGVVRIARSGGSVLYPCRFSLVAAMNPCACGYLGDSKRPCRCTEMQLHAYRGKLSGPLLDRFDLHVTMARVARRELLGAADGDSSAVVRDRVQEARARQSRRFGSAVATNASAPRVQLEASLRLSDEALAQLGGAIDGLGLSGRGVDRCLRVARTLADLAGSDDVGTDQLSEALSYRVEDAASAAA